MSRHDHRDRERHRAERAGTGCAKRGSKLPFLILLGAGCFVAVMLLRSDGRSDRVVTPPGAVKLARMSPRNVHEAAELNGIEGGAKAGQAALALANRTKTEPVKTGTVFIGAETVEVRTGAPATVVRADPQHPQAAIRIVGIRSDKAYTSRSDALADAQRVAKQRLAEVLLGLDPPIEVLPSDAVIFADYIAPNSAKDVAPTQENRDDWKASHLDPNRQWVTVDIEVSESQLRTLRAKQRLIELGWILGSVFAVLGLGYGTLRLDAAAKNYFTRSAAPQTI